MAGDIKFELSTERLSMRDVFERYGHCLPVIIEVTQGHYSGDIDMDTYSIGHTMRIGSYYKQLRVVAKDDHGSHLSIPVDYPIKFRVVKPQKKAGKEQTLREIVGETTLPVRIELCLPPDGYSLHIGQSIKQIESFGVLHLQQTYDETYFLANSITDGTLDENVLVVPIYHKNILVAMVTGFLGNDSLRYSRFRNHLNRVAETLDYRNVTGNSDIAAYSPQSLSSDLDNIYEYIEPSHYINLKQITTKKQNTPIITSKTNHPKNRAEPTAKKEANIYSEVTEEPPSHPPPVPAKTWLVSGSTRKKPLPVPQNHYVNNIGRAVVAPIQVLPPRRGSHDLPPIPKTASSASGPTNRYVSGYTIEETIRCLQPLRLEKYAETFRRGQINGDILLELDEETLKSDFKMKGYEAVKLIKFARSGYIPT